MRLQENYNATKPRIISLTKENTKDIIKHVMPIMKEIT